MIRSSWNAAVCLLLGGSIVLNIEHQPWWLALPVSVIQALLAAWLIHSYGKLRHVQGKLEAITQATIDGGQAITKAIVEQLVRRIKEKAPYN